MKLIPTPAQAIESRVAETLRNFYDPEIPVNIYDLGLIYEIKVDSANAVTIRMTLTAPNCPVAESLPLEVQSAVKKVPGVSDVQVELVFDPPWDFDKMSAAARLKLGMY